MSTRIVHVRLKDRIIAGCIAAYTKSGLNPVDTPIAKIVNRVLTAFITDAIENGMISEDDLLSAQTFLNNREPPEVTAPPTRSLPTVRIDDGDDDNDLQPAISEETREEMNSQIKKITSGSIEASGATFNPSFRGEAPPAMVAVPVPEDGTPAFNEIKERASPNDELINEAVDDKLLQRAICLVYSEMSPSLWGGDVAKKNVKAVYNLLKETEEN